MDNSNYQPEIRDSIIRELLEKVRKGNYHSYLKAIRLERIRLFQGAEIRFDFPVTALIGPNGGGKSTILGACACAYNTVQPRNVFRKSRVGDESMDDWLLEYDVLDKSLNPKGSIRAQLKFFKNLWKSDHSFFRNIKILGINRTVPAMDNPSFAFRKKLSALHGGGGSIDTRVVENIDDIKFQAEKILGIPLENFQLLELTFTLESQQIQKRVISRKEILDDGTELIYRKKIEPYVKIKKYSQNQFLYIGCKGKFQYSEFNFGSGEASVIRMVADIESQPDGSLVLIEEIENGLHPLAVRRMIDYLIDVASRKNIQTIFTTHSDYALASLPTEAIWSSSDGKLQQGKLSIEILRAVSGRIDKKLAIFVEDVFAKSWIEVIIREAIPEKQDEIGVYPVFGDGNAVKIHLNHNSDPSVPFTSICFVDGDSKQNEDEEKMIFRLPGAMPELTIFNSVINKIGNNLALLTAACQRPIEKQDYVLSIIKDISCSNRDPHLLFNQIGMKLGFLPEIIIRGAFLSIWIQENLEEAEKISCIIKQAIIMTDRKVR